MSTNDFKSSGWAQLHRVCGWLSLLLGFCVVVWGVAQVIEGRDNDSFALFSLGLFGLAGGMSCFFAAFLIDKLSEMAFYSKITADNSDVVKTVVYSIKKELTEKQVNTYVPKM